MSVVTEVETFVSEHIGIPDARRRTIVGAVNERGHLTYGPYKVHEPGRYRVAFRLALIEYPETRKGDAICAVLDVVADDGTVVLRRRQVRRNELGPERSDFVLEFDLALAKKLEFRMETTGQAAIRVDATVMIEHEPGAKPDLAHELSRLERIWENEAGFLDGFLRNVDGVIHIGANIGQERLLYELLGLDVLWIEAMEDVYRTLLNNIAPYRRQRALCALLTDRAGEVFHFNVANHGAGSSSILDFDEHATIMPDIKYVERREIVSTTFRDLVDEHEINLSRYQALSLDVEGSEHIVLRSMEKYLPDFDYIKCEVSDFQSRVGSPTSADLDDILTRHGFRQLARRAFAYGADHNGTYWDIVWKREKVGEALFKPGVPLPFIANDEPAWEHRMAERLNRDAVLPS